MPVPSNLPAAFADIDIADLTALSPRELFRDPGLLQIADESTWAARALKYARAGSSDTYDEIGFRFLAANPWKQQEPLQTRLGMQLERDKEERSLRDEGIESIRDQQPLLRHRPLDLPKWEIHATGGHDDRLLYFIEQIESPSARPRTDAWTFPLSAPPAAVLKPARPADAPLIGSQRQQFKIPGANWVPLSLLIDTGAFRRMQDWRTKLVRHLEPGRFHAFISHRWLSPLHPDPQERQARFVAWQLVAALCNAVRVAHTRGLHQPRRFNDQLQCVVGAAGTDLVESLLVNILRPTLDDTSLAAAAVEIATLDALVADAGIAQADADDRLERLRAILGDRPVLRTLVDRVLIWYDYASMPQQPRDEADEALFRDHLQYLIAVQAMAHTLVLLDEPADYLTRAWCTLEALFASGEVGLCDTMIGSSRRTARGGQTETYFTSLLLDHPHVVWRALLDTEVLRVQSPDDCLRRLQLGATDPRDLPYLYDRLCLLHAPTQVHNDPSAVVTGVFPVPIVNQGTAAVVPTRGGRNVVRQVDRSDPFTVDWSASVHLPSYRQQSAVPLTAEEVPPFARMDALADGHAACHIAIVASCEAEALLLGRWVRDRGSQLGRMLDNVSVVSMSWLASDVAPVGHMVHGALVARPVDARLWVVVAFAARFDACPMTVALTETLRECAIPYFELRVDEATENVSLVTSPPKGDRRRTKEDMKRFAVVPTVGKPFSTHVGGLFQAVLPASLWTEMSDEEIGQTQPAPPREDDLRAQLITVALTGNERLVAELCAAHADEIGKHVADWVRAPDWARANDLVLSQWANAMMAIAKQMDRLGHPELLERIAGRGRENPAVRFRDTVAQAQQLAAAGERDTSTSILQNLLAEMATASGPLVYHLRSLAFGALADNALHAQDYVSLREYNKRALAAALEARDGDGVRTFNENLDMVAAIEAYVREPGFRGDLLRCRERIARAQQLSDNTYYEASNSILREIEAQFEAHPDSEGRRYRAKVWGLLGLNCFRLRDLSMARSYTERALAECTGTNDRDGIRIYGVNLDVIDEASAAPGANP